MAMAELSIVALIAVVVAMSYLSIYPKVAGSDINRLLWCDIAISAFVLTLVGLKYWGTGHEFSLLIFETNWFWFTLIIYLTIEVPAAIWYAKKHNITMDSDAD
ncbi:conserved hypothetical protein [Shewanella halifaxensis HAW-EB4]|uniref:Transmembrane protein n=1 Tax=Shewanella halifaxensis (strain HAW-EB4) TaxID=458817 RepID=B0TP60_SHEHH|nr:hypothetical protein [Shewanella halifaxensis]ABZ76217.1 conserved hypothetical protein [Shewanella halifaxensis HAW-EB4]